MLASNKRCAVRAARRPLKRDEVEERKSAQYEEEMEAMRQRQQAALKEQEWIVQMQLAGAMPPTADYIPIQQPVDFVGEIDQLRALRAELSAELSTADASRGKELNIEIADLDAEINVLSML